MKLVSIILPTYNGSKYLVQAIDSCLFQTYGNLQLIIINDASTDETSDILGKYKDKRILVINNKENQGLPNSLNIGFSNSSGDYLTWTSDDNIYFLDAIEILVRYLDDHPDVELVYTDYERIDDTGQIIGHFDAKPPSLLHEYNVVGACFLYHRIVYEKIGDYDPSMRLVEDYDYWVRVSKSFKLASLNKTIYYYREHQQNLTNRIGLVRQEYMAEKVKQKWVGPSPYLYPSRFARCVASKYIDYAFDAYQRRESRLVRQYIIKALIYDPRWLRNRGVVSITLQSILTPFRNKP